MSGDARRHEPHLPVMARLVEGPVNPVLGWHAGYESRVLCGPVCPPEEIHFTVLRTPLMVPHLVITVGSAIMSQVPVPAIVVAGDQIHVRWPEV